MLRCSMACLRQSRDISHRVQHLSLHPRKDEQGGSVAEGEMAQSRATCVRVQVQGQMAKSRVRCARVPAQGQMAQSRVRCVRVPVHGQMVQSRVRLPGFQFRVRWYSPGTHVPGCQSMVRWLIGWCLRFQPRVPALGMVPPTLPVEAP